MNLKYLVITNQSIQISQKLDNLDSVYWLASGMLCFHFVQLVADKGIHINLKY